MGFSVKQVRALKRNPDHRHIRTRLANGRELTYLEGWYAITEANRIFGFDGWSRETIESKCILAREKGGTFLAVYVARVRLTVQANGATVIREGHGTGEGRGTSPGEVHDIALKAAETDATKRALATFGRPFGLELYRGGKATAQQKPLPSPPSIAANEANETGLVPDHQLASDHQDQTSCRGFFQCWGRCQFPCRLPPRRHDADPKTVPLLWPPASKPDRSALPGRATTSRAHDCDVRANAPVSGSAACAWRSARARPRPYRQERSHHRRAQTPARQGASGICGLTALPRLRPAAIRPASSAIFPTQSPRSQSQRRVHRSALPRSSPAAASGRQRSDLVGELQPQTAGGRQGPMGADPSKVCRCNRCRQPQIIQPSNEDAATPPTEA